MASPATTARRKPLPRFAATAIRQASRHFPVLLLTGARQVGKTTLLRSLAARGRGYVTLDDPLALRLARDDPALFLQSHPHPVLIDEVQYAPQLLPHIKIAVDGGAAPGSYWLTGSQPFHLMHGVAESLAGRVAVMSLLGLSRREALVLKAPPPFLPTPARLERLGASAGSAPGGVRELYSHIWRGSYPALVTQPRMSRDLFYASYLQTYLQRDVRDLARVGDETAFVRFLRAAAASTAQLLNIAELARDADVAPNTAKAWLSVLQASGIVALLQPWHANVTERLVKTPKLYFLDTGLCAYLTQWSSAQTLEAGAMAGAVLETWVFAEVLKSYLNAGLQTPMHYFRNKDQREIDLLIEADGRLYPVESKKSASPGPEALAAGRSLQQLGVTVGPGAVVCLVPRAVPLSSKPKVTAVPALAVSRSNSRLARRHLGVCGQMGIDDALDGVAAFGEIATRLTHAPAQIGVVEQAPYRARQSSGVAGRHQQAGDVGLDRVAAAR